MFNDLRRAAVFGAAVAASAMLAAGCGSSSSISSGGANGSSGGATHKSIKPVKIGFIQTFTSIPYFQVAGRGAMAAGAQDGHATVRVAGPAQATGTAEATLAENLQQSDQPDGFAPNPCILPAWSRALASLIRNVPSANVVAWDCTPIATPTQTSPVKTFVGINAAAATYRSTEIGVKAGGLSPSTTGTALVGNCSKGVPVLDDGQYGAALALKKLLPKVKVIEFATALDQNGNTAAWTSELGQATNVRFAIGACDQDAISLALLKKRGVGGHFVAGVNDPASVALYKFIDEGLLAGGVSVSPWVQGYVTVRMLIDGARGKKLPVGWIDSGVYPVTKSNAAQWVKGSASPQAETAFFTPYAKRVLDSLAARTKPMGEAVDRKRAGGS